MKLDDELLSRAATLVRDLKIKQLPHEDECPELIFSDKFEKNMQELIEKLERGEIRKKRVSMGWQYYVRNGIVAVLICFLLTCIAAPETVIAGYHKLIEVIETVVTEYTEYRYKVEKDASSEFKKLTFEFFPEGFLMTKERHTERSYHVAYENGEKYFTLEQRLITQENGMAYVVDTENADTKTLFINGDEVTLIAKDGVYNYLLVHDDYHIKGSSNMTEDTIIKILMNLTY